MFNEYEHITSEYDRFEFTPWFVCLFSITANISLNIEYEQLLADVGGDSFYIR
jgi:hypothetical protein